MNQSIQTVEMIGSKVALCRNLAATVATTEQSYTLSNSSTNPLKGELRRWA